MQVILLEKNRNLGNLGDQVNVKPGYGRNYLLPQGKAVPATPDNVKKFEERRAELERQAADQLQQAQQRAEQLEGLEVSIAAKCSDEGKLFGSVGVRDLAQRISEAGVAVERREVRLPEGPLRQTGDYEVAVQPHSDVTAHVNVSVVPK